MTDEPTQHDPSLAPDDQPSESPKAGAGGRSLRDPGGPGIAALAWVAIVGIVAFIALPPVFRTFFPQIFETAGEGPAVVHHTHPGGPIRLLGKYALGANEFAPGGEGPLLEQLDAMAAWSPSDQLRVAIVAASLRGDEAGLERLDQIEEQASEHEGGGAEFSPEFAEAFAIARRAMSQGVETLDATQRESIVASDGWFGELLLVLDLPEDDPERGALYGNAARLAMLLIVGVIGLIGLCVVGFGLFVTAIVLIATGKVKSAYAAPAPGGSVYLEAFALFLVAFVGLQFGSQIIFDNAGIDLSRILIWLVIPLTLWPLFRGASVASWRHALGWHSGKGVVREVGAGVLGYLAGVPIVALGLVCAMALSIFVGYLVEIVTGGAAPPPSHPAIDEIGSGGALGVVSLYLLASVWAPIVEETFFRGALYHHLRGRLGAIASGVLVAFVFASIHPQGIGLIPGLMGLAIVFALIREWRGSVIGCMVAHGLHNATLVTVLLLALG